MAKRNRITAAMSQTIAESSPLIKKPKIATLEQSNEEIVEIKLKDLIANPYQPRIDLNLQSLNELISSIEQNGLLQPIVVTILKENGQHVIVAGHRRYEAHKILGKDKIKAIIIKDLQDKDLAILSLTENLMRENLHPIENAIAIKNMLDNNIVESQNKLAEYVGLSKGYVSKLMTILKLPSVIVKSIKKDNYKDIPILLLINKLEDEEVMLEAYEAIKEKTRHDAEKYIKSKYFTKEKISYNIIDIKKSKTKISLNIDLKQLSSDQAQAINEKITNFNEEIRLLSEQWSQYNE